MANQTHIPNEPPTEPPANEPRDKRDSDARSRWHAGGGSALDLERPKSDPVGEQPDEETRPGNADPAVESER